MDYRWRLATTKLVERSLLCVLLALSVTARHGRSMRTHNNFRCYDDRASIVNGYYESLDDDTVIKAHCHNGFRLVGAEIRQCNTEEQRYTGTPPICVDIDECAIMEEGSGSGWDATSDDEDDVTGCHVNATCVNTHGGYKCICHEGLIGTGYSCKEPQCPQPLIENGGVILLGPEGNLAKFFCKPTYRLMGYSVLKCLNRNWFPPRQPFCKPKPRCPDPIPLENGDVIGDRFFPGNAIHYLCKSGYRLVGPSRRNCTRGLTWFPINPPICKEPETLLEKALRLQEVLEEMSKSSRSSRGYQSNVRFWVNQPNGVDLFLLFDGSSSVRETDFRLGVNFTHVLFTQLGVSNITGSTRVAALAFGSEVTVAIGLGESRSVRHARRQLASMQPPGGGTNLRAALAAVDRMILMDRLEGNDVRQRRVVFIVSDGRADVGSEATTKLAAKSLKIRKNVEIYTIGVGFDVHQGQLEEIASGPVQEHVYLFENYHKLKAFGDRVLGSRNDYSQCGVSATPDDSKKDRGDTEDGSWPWLVQIYQRFTGGESMVCAGTLVCDQWVLTAAQCFQTQAAHGRRLTTLPAHKFRVRIGIHNMTETNPRVMAYDVSDIYRYSAELRDDLTDDIALVRLKSPVQLSRYYRTVCLPANNSEEVRTRSPWRTSEEKRLYTVGWGTTGRGPGGHTAPLAFDVPKQEVTAVHESRQCTSLLRNVTGVAQPHGHLSCIGERYHLTCRGDLGGPVMTERSGDRHFIQVGVVSHNRYCRSARGATVMTNTITYLDWIRRTTSGCGSNH